MKKIILLSFIIFITEILTSNTLTTLPIEKEVLLAIDNYKTYTISIYKNTDKKTPYSISVAGNNSSSKELMVIEQDDDLFKFVLVEKTATEILYYPFAWSELKMITAADLKENSRKILDKQARPVERKPLK
ncbi:MAG: hypothetical protein K0S32_514 [Bacteroidetes bacterium]|jgi:hypothetical protein|nr:hypothetical protein [Bacteroidota bacterium]